MTAPDDRWNAGITWLDEPLEGASSGPLAGRTLVVKDLIDTAGIRTTYGSRVYADHVPTRHATVVQRVLDAGATILGKANLAEFAWGVLGVERVLRHGSQPRPAGPDDRRLVQRERRGDRGRPLRPRDRHGHGLLCPAARRRVRARRAEDTARVGPDRRRLSAVPVVRHGRPARPLGHGRCGAVVGARRAPGPRAAPRRARRRAPAPCPGSRRRPGDGGERRRRRVGRPPRRSSAPASSRPTSRGLRPTRGRCSSTRRPAPMPRPFRAVPTSTGRRSASSSRRRSASTRRR